MRRLNKKGFTLIELLAVIIILGVLLLIAIPAMTGIIEGAKKDAFISTARNYITQVRYYALQGDYELPGQNACVYVPINGIELEKGSSTKSVYDKPWVEGKAYVVISNVPQDNGQDRYTYYFAGIDSENNGIAQTEENAMVRNDVKRRSSDLSSQILATPKVGETTCTLGTSS